MFTGGEHKYYYHADTLGSIRALTNASGAVASPLISIFTRRMQPYPLGAE
jgi:hypothetical protein